MTSKQKKYILCAIVIGTAWMYLLITNISTPHVTYLRWLPPLQTAFMSRDSNDEIKYQWVPLNNISIHLRNAVVVAEDGEFFNHPGFDIESIKKAIDLNLKRKKWARGASTISQQLARNLYLSPYKSVFRKLRELLITLKLERELPKDRILEIYLNVAEWGNGIYGAEAAARHYFGKPASALSKHEAAFLAAILPRPRFFDKHRLGPFIKQRTAVIEKMI